ncbi:MAG: DUF4159 domain-containing protein [Pirellulaceae bacterium]|nr:DUF4159 domain-containing protein [Pirellulaceae bacterium]
MPPAIFAPCVLSACLVMIAWSNHARLLADSNEPAPTPPPSLDAFTFVRVRYDSSGGFGESWYRYEGRDWQRWETDYPRAEKNLIFRLNELTSLRINPDPIVLRLTDPAIRDYPFIFMSDVGWQRLSAHERVALEEYLSAGGFLWVDDFWGQAEWENFERNIGKIGSSWQWRPIPPSHPLMTIVYQVKECPQIPARIFFEQTGRDWDPPQVHRYPSGGNSGVNSVHFMGLFDANNRLLVVATHNTDIADGWEREGESKEYFDRFSIRSYAITINILVYALTH